MEVIFFFVFFYPLFMAIFWMTGAIVFFIRRERHEPTLPELEGYPRIAVLVPCHDEELCIRDAIDQLARNKYPNFEIIAINDGSTDGTGAILRQLSGRIDRLRVVTLMRNYGKAMALKAGVLATSAEYLMCIDADALLDEDALFWMMRHFLEGPRVGAVTGNPRVVNRTTLLSRIQIGEFSAIIGMVKRSQRNIGRMFTVSGVNACFRRAAVHDVGYWSPETVTEDIDISWKLQLRRWDIRYEPRAITRILVPETLRALWRQRLRWARGGVEAAIKYASAMWHWKSRRMWSVYTEFWVGVLWCYAFAFTVLCCIGTNLLPTGVWPEALTVPTLIPGWTGVVLAVTCLLQFTVGLAIDSHYEGRGLIRYLYWAIWFPAMYWLINAATTVVALPEGLYNLGKTRYAVWKSRGLRLHDMFTWLRSRKRAERRLYFRQRPDVVYARRITEVIVTFLFWGLWVYLITPLLSVLLWFVGVYFFYDRMIAMGGYEAFTRGLVNYGVAVLAMWLLLTLWILWNDLYYGRHERRRETRQPVYWARNARHMELSPRAATRLRSSKQVALRFDENDHPVIERLPRTVAMEGVGRVGPA